MAIYHLLCHLPRCHRHRFHRCHKRCSIGPTTSATLAVSACTATSTLTDAYIAATSSVGVNAAGAGSCASPVTALYSAMQKPASVRHLKLPLYPLEFNSIKRFYAWTGTISSHGNTVRCELGWN